ncbi:MAG: S1/P1 nuclease [Candidatus Competibacteraceae bacterium]
MHLHRFFSLYFLFALLVSSQAVAWGPDGHQTVGAIADRLLAGTPAATHVSTLLGGLSLQQASVWADCAKGVDPRKNYAYAPVGKHPECKPFETPAGKAAMRDFVRRNDTNCQPKPGEESCHKQYHYTDVAIQHDRYQPGLVGTRDDDLAQAVLATTQVLQGGTAPAPFNLKDQQEALLLLTHYVGDLHQPLHVGAIYLDNKGKRVNPDTGTFDPQTETQGGNKLILKGTNQKLHAVWDEIPASLTASHVNAAWLQQAKGIPATGGPVLQWPIRWAGDTLFGAQNAFTGLQFSRLQSGHWTVTVPANYNTRKQRLQQEELTKAGAHLAELLNALWP